jgi:hypothetical protein
MRLTGLNLAHSLGDLLSVTKLTVNSLGNLPALIPLETYYLLLNVRSNLLRFSSSDKYTIHIESATKDYAPIRLQKNPCTQK